MKEVSLRSYLRIELIYQKQVSKQLQGGTPLRLMLALVTALMLVMAMGLALVISMPAMLLLQLRLMGVLLLLVQLLELPRFFQYQSKSGTVKIPHFFQ